MTVAQRAGKYVGGLVFGLVAAWILSQVVAKFWPDAQMPVFVVLLIVWLSGFVQILLRDLRADPEVERAVFVNPEQWKSEELPPEFRFITRDTTLQQVINKVGQYKRITESGLVRYDLPSGGALFLFPESPSDPASKIRGIQLYRTEGAVPMLS